MAAYNMTKKILMWCFDYGKTKIEDIHYNRNAVKVRETQNLDDL